MSDLIEGYLGKTVEGKKSRLPAKLDFMQSFTGGFLALFMWAHMLLVSSILISKDFMYTVTKLWFIQAFTGFVMFFLGSVHLYIIMTHSDAIGPYASSDRIWSEWMWPLYILLLLAVEFHGTIGLYRLCVKWGWFDGENPKATRKALKKLKWALTVFFLVLGFASLAAYMKIGYENSKNNVPRDSFKPSAHIMNYDLKTKSVGGIA